MSDGTAWAAALIVTHGAFTAVPKRIYPPLPKTLPNVRFAMREHAQTVPRNMNGKHAPVVAIAFAHCVLVSQSEVTRRLSSAAVAVTKTSVMLVLIFHMMMIRVKKKNFSHIKRELPLLAF